MFNRILTILCSIALTLSLCSCGSTSSTNDNTENTLSVGTLNSVDEYVDFTLFKISTTTKVTASLAGDLYFENENSGETYIDVVFDLTNTGTAAVASSDVMTATASNASGIEYTNTLYAIETNGGTYMSQYENIAPLATVRYHCAISVPNSETALTLNFIINDVEYSFEYTVGEVVRNAAVLAVGESIEAENFATMVFNGTEYTDDLLPSNTSSYYSHYQIDNNSNTYLVVKFDITNYQSTAKKESSFVGIKATYQGKYTYTGFTVVEDTDGTGFGQYEDIAPLSTRHFYCLIEIPKTVIENDVELTISFNGQEYIYTGK